MCLCFFIFFFKQKTAYEMRISDWSSDVCSSDLQDFDVVTGEVSDINIRATRITTNDNIEILVPNSEFVTGRVVNWTHQEASRRMRISFGVAYGSNKEMVRKAALEAAAEVPATLTADGPSAPEEIGRAACRERGGQYV